MRFALLFILLVQVSFGATYYVDYDAGSDSNNGTSTGTAFKRAPGDDNATGTADATTLAAGDIVKLKGGVTYYGEIDIDWAGAIGNPIIYDGNNAGDWGTGRAVVDGSYVANASGFLVGASARGNITIKGFEIRNVAGDADDATNVISAAAGTYTNTVSTGGFGVNFYSGSHTNIYLDNLYIHRIGGWRNGIGWAAATIGGAGIAIKSGSNVTVTNCEVTKCHTAIGFYADLTQNNLLVTHCDLHDYIVWGVDVAPFGNNGVIRDVTIRNTSIRDYAQFTLGNWLGSDETPHTDGIFLRSAGYLNSTWSNINVFNMNFYCDTPAASLGGTASIFISEGASATIYNCLFNQDIHSRAIGISYSNPGGWTNTVRIYNNTFIAASAAIITDTEADADQRHVYVQNNIFRKPSGSANNSPMLTALSGVYADVINNNIYYDPDWTILTKYVFVGTGGDYRYMAGFVSLGFEASGGVYDDPDFVSFGATPSGRDLRLQATSPAINAGADLSAYFTTDKDGNTRAGTWDIGAFEYVPSTTYRGYSFGSGVQLIGPGSVRQ